MTEKDIIEKNTVEHFINLYNEQENLNYIVVKHSDAPDFICKDVKNNKALNIEVQAFKEKLNNTTESIEKKKLEDDLKACQEELHRTIDEYEMGNNLLHATDCFVENSGVIMLNCFAAYNDKGKDLMKKLGEVFLRKNGGRVMGYTNYIWLPKKIHPLVTFLTGVATPVAHPTIGKLFVHKVLPQGSSEDPVELKELDARHKKEIENAKKFIQLQYMDSEEAKEHIEQLEDRHKKEREVLMKKLGLD